MDETPALAGTLVTISFVDGEITGSTGCNTYSGTATWGDGDLTVDPGLVATRRSCDAPIMDQEQRFLEQDQKQPEQHPQRAGAHHRGELVRQILPAERLRDGRR